MLKKHIKAFKAVFSRMEKSTLALFIAGFIALVLTLPVSAFLKADVTSEDSSTSSEGSYEEYDKEDYSEEDYQGENSEDYSGDYTEDYHPSADEQWNEEGDHQEDGGQQFDDEQQKKNWEREKTRLSKDYRWLLRELQKNGTEEDIDRYNEILKKVENCAEFDWDCTQDIRWEMDDFNFEAQDRMEQQRCSKDGDRIAKETAHRVAQMKKEMAVIERDFGSEAAEEFEEIINEYTDHSEEFAELTKSCKWDEAEDYRWENLEPIQDLMREFWDKWGQQQAREFQAGQCPAGDIDAEISRIRDEEISTLPAELQPEAEDLLKRAEFLIRACREAAEADDFENVSKTLSALEKIGRQAEKLGLAAGEDNGQEIRGYRELHREDLKGFENEDKLEKVFEDMDAEDDYEVYTRISGADRENLNKILEGDEEFAKEKLKFLKYIDAMDGEGADLVNEFLQQQAEIKALMDQIAQLKAAMGELQSQIAKYNFVGEGADMLKEKLQNQDLSEEELRRAFEEAKEKSRRAKFENGMIPFQDTDDDTYYFDAVRNLSEENIIKGKEDGSYDPAAATTIAEALKIVLETTENGYSEGSTGVSEYDSHWAKGYFKKALELGVPIADKNVNRGITRGELAEMIVKALGISYENLDTPKFGDLSNRHPYYAAIQTLNAKGVFNGSNGNARPDDSLNRAEIATFMNNVLENL